MPVPPIMCRPVVPGRHAALVESVVPGGPKLYSDSVRGHCTGCPAEVWIGPRGQVLMSLGVARPLCVDCVIDWLRQQGSYAVDEGSDAIEITVVDLGNPE